jgi:hypothetical protein
MFEPIRGLPTIDEDLSRSERAPPACLRIVHHVAGLLHDLDEFRIAHYG